MNLIAALGLNYGEVRATHSVNNNYYVSSQCSRSLDGPWRVIICIWASAASDLVVS